MAAQPIKKILTPEELADQLQVRVRTILDLARKDRIPHIRIGVQKRFILDEVVEALRSDPPKDPPPKKSKHAVSIDDFSHLWSDDT
jgi:excisionase family DNA binding protein